MDENSGDSSIASVKNPTDQLLITKRFADYFVICGLDFDTGLEPDRFAGKKFPKFNCF